VLGITVLLAASAFIGLHVYQRFEEIQVEIRYEQLLARQEVAAQVVDDYFGIQKPWLMPAINPPENTPATIAFEFMGQEHSVQAEANPRIYYGAKTADRTSLWENFWLEVGNAEGLLEKVYYDALTFEPQMDHAIESVLVQLREIRDTYDLSNDEYIELIVKYVQSIPYCYDHGTTDLDRPVGCPRTPIQTLVDGTGDCDETAMLLVALLHRENFPVSLLFFEPEQHMSVGLRTEGKGFRETGYIFVESTSFSYISEMPEVFGWEDEEIVLESTPLVLSIGTEVENPMPYFSAEALEEIERIIDVRNRAEAAADNLRHWIERTPMSQADFNRHVARHDLCFTALNRFQYVKPDPAGIENTDFMDRVQAIEWINQNAWWE